MIFVKDLAKVLFLGYGDSISLYLGHNDVLLYDFAGSFTGLDDIKHELEPYNDMIIEHFQIMDKDIRLYLQETEQ